MQLLDLKMMAMSIVEYFATIACFERVIDCLLVEEEEEEEEDYYSMTNSFERRVNQMATVVEELAVETTIAN